jgi:SAM-dependent methyltransferase
MKPEARAKLLRFFPEVGAGGFTAHEPRLLFFNRVRTLLEPGMRVLDFGAGRGKWGEIETGWVRRVTRLRGDCREVVGCDPDPAVVSNPDVDVGVQVEPHGSLPFADASFDMIVSWATFEHLDRPEFHATELSRVLKPGGWICAWTPSRWSYFALAAAMMPDALHTMLLRRVDPTRKHELDTFPTVYRLNTRGAIRRCFPADRFEDYSHLPFADPGYFGNNRALYWLWSAWLRVMPDGMRSYWHIFLRKRLSDG